MQIEKSEKRHALIRAGVTTVRFRPGYATSHFRVFGSVKTVCRNMDVRRTEVKRSTFLPVALVGTTSSRLQCRPDELGSPTMIADEQLAPEHAASQPEGLGARGRGKLQSHRGLAAQF
jgi:hypothetical protein